MDEGDLEFSGLKEEQRRGRRRARKVALFLVGFFAIGFVSLGLVITQPVFAGSPKHIGPPVDSKRLETHVRALSETFVPRDWKHPENLDRAAAYIKERFEQSGAAVSEQSFEVRGKTYRNVCARFGPEAGERIVIGAHYDAFDELPAADDNASGVAGILELASLLNNKHPSTTVELVAYTLEEPPFFRTQDMGSARHAQALKAQGIKVRAMLSVEMIGTFSDEEGSQRYPSALLGLFYPSKGNFIAVVGHMGSMDLARKVKRIMRGASPLPVRSTNAPRSIPGIDWSDHHPYWDAGYPAVMITDTASNRTRHYHRSTDTAEKLDYVRMAQVVQGLHAVALELGSIR